MSAAEALPPVYDTTAILGPLTDELIAACPILDPANRRPETFEADTYDAEDWLAERYEAAVEAAWEARFDDGGPGWPSTEPSDWN